MARQISFVFIPKAPVNGISASYSLYSSLIPAIPLGFISNTKKSEINRTLNTGHYELNVAFHGTGSVTVDVIDTVSKASLLESRVVCTTVNQIYFSV